MIFDGHSNVCPYDNDFQIEIERQTSTFCVLKVYSGMTYGWKESKMAQFSDKNSHMLQIFIFVSRRNVALKGSNENI